MLCDDVEAEEEDRGGSRADEEEADEEKPEALSTPDPNGPLGLSLVSVGARVWMCIGDRSAAQ